MTLPPPKLLNMMPGKVLLLLLVSGATVLAQPVAHPVRDQLGFLPVFSLPREFLKTGRLSALFMETNLHAQLTYDYQNP